MLCFGLPGDVCVLPEGHTGACVPLLDTSEGKELLEVARRALSRPSGKPDLNVATAFILGDDGPMRLPECLLDEQELAKRREPEQERPPIP